jgi:hypothetical protein
MFVSAIKSTQRQRTRTSLSWTPWKSRIPQQRTPSQLTYHGMARPHFADGGGVQMRKCWIRIRRQLTRGGSSKFGIPWRNTSSSGTKNTPHRWRLAEGWLHSWKGHHPLSSQPHPDRPPSYQRVSLPGDRTRKEELDGVRSWSFAFFLLPSSRIFRTLATPSIYV